MSPESIRKIYNTNTFLRDETFGDFMTRVGIPCTLANAQLVAFVLPWQGMLHAEAAISKLEECYEVNQLHRAMSG